MIRSRDTVFPLDESIGDKRDYPLRRKARVLALKLLYQIDVNEDEPEAAFTTFFQREDVASADKSVKDYARQICEGIIQRKPEIDPVIDGVSEHWKLERMTAVDRNILRVAVYEFIQGEVPSKVVIDEAIEVAKEFGTGDSSKFINGLLDAVRKKLGLET